MTCQHRPGSSFTRVSTRTETAPPSSYEKQPVPLRFPSPQTPSWLQGGRGTRTRQSRNQVLLATGMWPDLATPESLNRYLEITMKRCLSHPRLKSWEDGTLQVGQLCLWGQTPRLRKMAPEQRNQGSVTAPEHLNPAPPEGIPQPFNSRDQHALFCTCQSPGVQMEPPEPPLL